MRRTAVSTFTSPGTGVTSRQVQVCAAFVYKYQSVELEPILRPKGAKDFILLPRRWVVERTFAWLAQFRRLNKDYERLNKTSEAIIHVAMIRLMLRRLA